MIVDFWYTKSLICSCWQNQTTLMMSVDDKLGLAEAGNRTIFRLFWEQFRIPIH